MILLVNSSEVLTIHVRVNLSRGNIGVAEHLLHCSKVRAALEEVRREGVAERVRRNVLRDLRSLDVMPKNLPRSHAREWMAACVQDENPLAFAVFETRPQLTQVNRNSADR
jgi:hypothetical protein